MLISAYAYLLLMPGHDVNEYLILSNFVIVLSSTLFCFTGKKKPFSLFKMVLLFYAIFFGLAPLLEYRLRLLYWGGAFIEDADYLTTNIAIIISIGLYVGCYYFFFKRSNLNFALFIRIFSIASSVNKQSTLPFRLLILSSIGFLAIFSYYGFDFTSLLFRGGDFEKTIATDDKSIGLIVGNFLRPLVFNSFAVYVLIRRRIDAYTILLFAFAILGASPTALARFATATLYVSVILLYIWRTNSKGFHLNNLILIGFVFAFPLLDLFRGFKGWGELDFGINLDFLTEGHFDAYQQLVRVIIYDFVSYGTQLLGAIFFFVPRSIWPDKPWGSGQLIAENLHFSFTNLSMPLLGEGYINFGWFGLFAFVAVLAFVTAKLDKVFWCIPKNYTSSLLPLAYMQMVGLVFFIMRGDLLNGTAYSCGILTSLTVIAYWLRVTSFKPVSKIKE